MKRIKKRYFVLFGILLVIVLAGGGFLLYVSDYYHADTVAEAVAQQTDMTAGEGYTVLRPETPGETGLIFYPGAKVEETAYLPLLDMLREKGVTCVLVEMPFRLAVLNPDAAGQIMANLPEIQNWYIGGHSLGGAMASSFAAAHPDEIAGVVLLGAYIYGDLPSERALIIYGENDLILDRTKIEDGAHVLIIPGGNHAGFGNYGAQEGDGEAAITPGEQQEAAAEAISAFMQR